MSANTVILDSVSGFDGTSAVAGVTSGVLMPPVTGEAFPGVWMSPAYAGTLSAKARIAAAQIAFRDFMVCSPIQFFRIVKAVAHDDGSPTAGFNEAHNSRLPNFMQDFLHNSKWSYLT